MAPEAVRAHHPIENEWNMSTLRGTVGDELTVPGPPGGDHDRHGQILEVHGPDGAPPYLVSWRDGWSSLFFPWDGVVIEHRDPAVTR